jgi:NitT/TauT family transport system substrate-binding protein
MGVTNTLAYDIWASPSIKTPQDLKGKTFAIATFGGPSHNTTMLALKHFRLDEKRNEIKLRVIGSASARVQALISGAVDATVVDSPLAAPLRAKNFTRLGSFQDLGIPFAGNALVTTRRYIKEARHNVTAIVQATLEGIAYIHDPKNRAKVVDVLAKNMRLAAEDAEIAYRDYLLPMVQLRPYPDMKALQSTIDVLSVSSPKVASLKPADIVDLSFLSRVESPK